MVQLLRGPAKFDVSPVYGVVFALLRDAFETLPRAVENRKQLEQQAENGSDGESYSDHGDDSDGELAEEDEDGETPAAESLACVSPTAMGGGSDGPGAGGHGDDGDAEEGDVSCYTESDWDEDELEEGLFHETPLDGIDLYQLAIGVPRVIPTPSLFA